MGAAWMILKLALEMKKVYQEHATRTLENAPVRWFAAMLTMRVHWILPMPVKISSKTEEIVLVIQTPAKGAAPWTRTVRT